MLRRTAKRGITEFNYGSTEAFQAVPPLNRYFSRIVDISSQRLAPLPAIPIRRSKLDNGVTIATVDNGGMTASVGIYADAGAKYDPANAPGLNYVMRWGLLTSNMESSVFQVDKNFRSIGASYDHAEVRKQFIAWKSQMFRHSWKLPCETMLTAVSVPRFPHHDIMRFRDTMDNILEERMLQDPREYCVDQLETIAFYKSALGNPRYVPPKYNDACSAVECIEQYSTYCKPTRITVAAVNVDHDALVATYTNQAYPHSGDSPHHARCRPAVDMIGVAEDKLYTPMKEHVEHASWGSMQRGVNAEKRRQMTVAKGWLTNGYDQSVDTFAVSLVLQSVVSNAHLETIRMTSGHDTMFGIRTFYRPFASAGLLGLTFRDDPANVRTLIDKFGKLENVVVDDTVVTRSKKVAQTSFAVDNGEQNSQLLDFIATSPYTMEEVLVAINKVQTKAVKDELDKMIAMKSTMYAIGDETNELPTLKRMESKIWK